MDETYILFMLIASVIYFISILSIFSYMGLPTNYYYLVLANYAIVVFYYYYKYSYNNLNTIGDSNVNGTDTINS
jgi:hypothetical protein